MCEGIIASSESNVRQIKLREFSDSGGGQFEVWVGGHESEINDGALAPFMKKVFGKR